MLVRRGVKDRQHRYETDLCNDNDYTVNTLDTLAWSISSVYMLSEHFATISFCFSAVLSVDLLVCPPISLKRIVALA